MAYPVIDIDIMTKLVSLARIDNLLKKSASLTKTDVSTCTLQYYTWRILIAKLFPINARKARNALKRNERKFQRFNRIQSRHFNDSIEYPFIDLRKKSKKKYSASLKKMGILAFQFTTAVQVPVAVHLSKRSQSVVVVVVW